MEKTKFNNKPNERIQIRYQTSPQHTLLLDYFISRSIAVVGVVFAITDSNINVLITKRSNKMRDEASKLGLVCGYLDFDENCHDAMIREVYEETTLYLPDYENLLITNNNKKPFFIQDEPTKDKRQNVSMIYLSVYDFSKNMNIFPSIIKTTNCKETEFAQWMTFSEFYTTYNQYSWAFNHDETIKSAIVFFNKGQIDR